MRQLDAQTSMRLLTQNVRRLTAEKLEMIIHTMKYRRIHAAALQEAWVVVPSGRDNDETDGFLITWHGETVLIRVLPCAVLLCSLQLFEILTAGIHRGGRPG